MNDVPHARDPGDSGGDGMPQYPAGTNRDDWQQSIYEELHRLADAALRREAAGHSLQPTLMANDAYLYLLKQNNVDIQRRSQVMAVGAQYLRRLLVDHARRRKAQKRGGEDHQRQSLSLSIAADARLNKASQIDVLELNEVLDQLSQRYPRPAKVVELKFFGGMTGEEVAEHMGVAVRTVNTDWRFAKAWLNKRLADSGEQSQPS